MQLRTKVASVGINNGQSYVLSTSTMYRVIRGGIIFMISRGVSGSHALHGTQAYKHPNKNDLKHLVGSAEVPITNTRLFGDPMMQLGQQKVRIL